MVKQWVEKILFSSFDLKKDIMRKQIWALRNNDVFIYAKLIAEHQLVFQGTHDIISHIAGMNSEGMKYAAMIAKLIFDKLYLYFGEHGKGNLPLHLVPFLIGVFLDDLTQKLGYFSKKRTDVIKELLQSIDPLQINPQERLVLKRFPQQMNHIYRLVRNEMDISIELIKSEIKKLYNECNDLIIPFQSSVAST